MSLFIILSSAEMKSTYCVDSKRIFFCINHNISFSPGGFLMKEGESTIIKRKIYFFFFETFSRNFVLVAWKY